MKIALIGNRVMEKDTKYAEDVLLYYKLCYRLACLGITMTSGLASHGPDAIAQKAYSKAIQDKRCSLHQLEVYVASEKFIYKSSLPYANLSIIAPEEHIEACNQLCEELHPAWDKCNEYAKGQHRRNCHQILGYDLNKPVDAVICWTVDGKKIGGTSTALGLALKNNIPVFNLGCSDKNKVLNDIKEFLLEQNKKNGEAFINEL